MGCLEREAPHELQNWSSLETEIRDAVRAVKDGGGNTLSTGGARGKRGKVADMCLSRWIDQEKKRMEQKETTAVLMALDSGSGVLAQQVRMQRRSSSL